MEDGGVRYLGTRCGITLWVTYPYTCQPTNILTYIDTYIHSYIHTYTHIYTDNKYLNCSSGFYGGYNGRYSRQKQSVTSGT